MHNSVEFGDMCAQHFLSVLHAIFFFGHQQSQMMNTDIIPILQIRKKRPE